MKTVEFLTKVTVNIGFADVLKGTIRVIQKNSEQPQAVVKLGTKTHPELIIKTINGMEGETADEMYDRLMSQGLTFEDVDNEEGDDD